jgi:predicted PurR-regulated permease PerM
MKNNLEFYEALEVLKDDKLTKARVVVIKTIVQEFKNLSTSLNSDQVKRDLEEITRISSNLRGVLPSSTDLAQDSKNFEEYKGKVRNATYQLIEGSEISNQTKEFFLSMFLPAIFTVVESYANEEILKLLYEEIPETIERIFGVDNKTPIERKSYEK